MASPPFLFDEANPLNTALVSTYPSNERTFRDNVNSWTDFEHGSESGRHKIPTGNDAARDAITDWETGSLWISTQGTLPSLQVNNGTKATPDWENITGITTVGDLAIGVAAGMATRLAVGASGEILTSNGTIPTWSAFSTLPLAKNHIAKLELSKSAADVLTIAAGQARDATDAHNMVLAAFTKDVSSTWAVGTGNGSLDTGAYAATTLYAVWLIKRSDTSVVDVLSSESFSAPTMPTNYDFKRLIGYFVTDSGPDIIAFTQVGDYFRMTGDIITDVNDNTITSDTFEVAALSVPPSCLAHIYARVVNTATTGFQMRVNVRTAGAADAADHAEAFSSFTIGAATDSVASIGIVLVNSSSQVDYTALEADQTATVVISTLGCLMLTRSNPV